MNELAEKQCIPCRSGATPLAGVALEKLAAELGPEWAVIATHHLEREFRFRNFVEALAFVNRVGELAEQQNHHPDLELAWGRAKVKIWTHKIDGLTESDFVYAAKVNGLV